MKKNIEIKTFEQFIYEKELVPLDDSKVIQTYMELLNNLTVNTFLGKPVKLKKGSIGVKRKIGGKDSFVYNGIGYPIKFRGKEQFDSTDIKVVDEA